MALSRSTVSGIVGRVLAKGLVARSADDVDRRLTRISVTPVARQFMRERAPQLTAQPLLEALSRLSEQDRRVIVRGLRILRGALDAETVGG